MNILQKQILSIVFLLVFLLSNSCQSNTISANASDKIPKWLEKYSFYKTKDYYLAFNNYAINKATEGDINSKIQQFYLQKTTPFWTENGYRDDLITQWLQIVDSSKYHGIPKNLLHYSTIINQIDVLSSNFADNPQDLYELLAELEWTCTESFIKYSEIMAFGATNPKKMMGEKWYHQTDLVTQTFIQNSLNNLTIFNQYLNNLSPKNNNYSTLQTELSNWFLIIQKKDSLSNDSLNSIQKKINSLEVNLERNRWRILPEKKSNYLVVNIADFTLKAYLNDTVAAHLKICCGKSYNSADIAKMTPKEGIYPHAKWASPFLYSEIEQLILNPEWNIPPSILKDEYYPKLIKDNMAVINKEKLYVLNSRNERVTPDTINWKNFSSRAIPYRLIQSSGYYNALGIIKFNFPNPESVYLHDTPQKAAFNKTNRAVSHGCIRVQNPLQLAEVVYAHNKLTEIQIEKIKIDLRLAPSTKKGEEYLKEKVEKESKYLAEIPEDSKKFTRTLRPTYFSLPKKYPVYIEYYTCFVDSVGKVQFRPDVYQKDEAIIYFFNQYK